MQRKEKCGNDDFEAGREVMILMVDLAPNWETSHTVTAPIYCC